ncbi:unnamed protein product [Mycena citricolor]|uniref:Uncharacterized protein n=1 Tax=Mycena citricolor TaxID=2018698 RepID=A0AAD2JY30_9AGAR|nr:unnamed protein product [Mycena citricolor]
MFRSKPIARPQVLLVEDTPEYQYVLNNFALAHKKVEEQRGKLKQQEELIAQLQDRVALLEGVPGLQSAGGGSVDDFSIKNGAAQLDKLINRWASDIVRRPPTPLHLIYEAALSDVTHGREAGAVFEGSSMQVQSLMRHALAETICEGFINCLIVTSSKEANVQLTRIHEHIFARDPTVAAVWRRQTFSAAVETCTPEMADSILNEQIPHLTRLLAGTLPSAVLDAAYHFSRMLHGTTGSGDAFYRAFVPELGSALYPSQNELVKRCLRHEAGQVDRVGCTIFPGLVKVGLTGEHVSWFCPSVNE